MSKIEIVEVESKKQVDQFINYPNQLYRDDPNYVAPLKVERREFFDLDKNPFYRFAKVKLFMAQKDGRICGRIATCVNFHHNDFQEELVGAFGFFDCPDDYEIASMLLKVAMITLKREGMEKMRGPLNFSTNHECGFLVDGFDSPPVVMMTYNPSYLPALAEKFGLKKIMDLLAMNFDFKEEIPPRIQKVNDYAMKKNNITVRQFNPSDFDGEVRRLRDVYNQAWEKNWGFVPMNEEEFIHTTKTMKQIYDPRLIHIAEADGKPVGFSMSLPDINQALKYLKGSLFPFGIFKLFWHTKIRNKINTLRVVTFGVIPEVKNKGVDSMVYINSYIAAKKSGYKFAEISWILETNDLMVKGAINMGGKLYKRYRITEMPL